MPGILFSQCRALRVYYRSYTHFELYYYDEDSFIRVANQIRVGFEIEIGRIIHFTFYIFPSLVPGTSLII